MMLSEISHLVVFVATSPKICLNCPFLHISCVPADHLLVINATKYKHGYITCNFVPHYMPGNRLKGSFHVKSIT